MKVVNIHQAKTTLSQLLNEVGRGEDVVIARNGKPVARLTRLPLVRRQPGILRGTPEWQDFAFDPATFAPMTDEELAAEGWPA